MATKLEKFLKDKARVEREIEDLQDKLRRAQRQNRSEDVAKLQKEMEPLEEELIIINQDLQPLLEKQRQEEQAAEEAERQRAAEEEEAERKRAEEEEQARLEAEDADRRSFGGRWRSFKGKFGAFKDKFKRGGTKFKSGAGKVGEGAGKFHGFVVSNMPAILVIVLTLIFGLFFHFFYPLLLIAGLIIGGLLLLYRINPALTGWILLLIVAAVVLGILFGPLGKIIGFDVTTFKLLGAQSSQQAAGTQAYAFSTMGCVFGTGGCEQFQKDYSSQQASTEYIEGTKDVGVRLSEVRAARDFYSDTPLEIQGILNAKGFLYQPIAVELSATSRDIEGFSNDETEALLGTDLLWKCDNNNYELKENGSRLLQNKFFTCSHAAIIKPLEEDEIITMPVKVTAKARNTIITASKQFVLTRQEIFRSGGNTLEYFFTDYDQNDFASHKLGDESVDFAIRDTSDKDVRSTGVNNHIEIKLENPQFHAGKASVNKDRADSSKYAVYLYLPKLFEPYIKGGDFVCGQMESATETERAWLAHTTGSNFIKCKAVRGPKSSLDPNEFFTWTLTINVGDEAIIGDKLVFNVAAYADYDYENTELLSVDVKGIGGAV